MEPFKRDGLGLRTLMVAVALMAASAFLLSACGPKQFRTTMVKRNNSRDIGPNGLAHDGKNMIIGDRTLVMVIDSIETGSFMGADSKHTDDGFYLTVKTPEPMPRDVKVCGLAWEGECCGDGFLWIADSLSGELIKLDNENRVIKRLAAPGTSPCGLAFADDTLWVTDTDKGKIYNISTDTGQVLKEFNSPVEQPLGLAWDCNALWVSGVDKCTETRGECNIPRVVKLDVESGHITAYIKLPKELTRPSSLTWSEGTIWVGDYALGRVFAFKDKGKKIKDDPVDYSSDITVTKRRLVVMDMPADEAEKLDREQQSASVRRAVKAKEATDEAERARAAADEAERAAEMARRAAQDAQDSAEKSEKAFELQLKK